MKQIFWLMFAMMWFYQGGIFGQVEGTVPDTLTFRQIETESDSTIYELIILDPAFEAWFLRIRRPESYYTLDYLESWNRKLVNQWNVAVLHPQRTDCSPTTYLDYDWKISYGITLNYKLFYYFRYMHERCELFSVVPARW